MDRQDFLKSSWIQVVYQYISVGIRVCWPGDGEGDGTEA